VATTVATSPATTPGASGAISAIRRRRRHRDDAAVRGEHEVVLEHAAERQQRGAHGVSRIADRARRQTAHALPVGPVVGAAADHDLLDAHAPLNPHLAALDGDVVRRRRPRELTTRERGDRIAGVAGT